MDQNPVNDGSGGYMAPQGYAPQANYAPPVEPKKAGKKRLWVWIGCGAAAVVLAVVLILVLSPGLGGGVSENPEPLMYMDDGDVFLAVGAKSIELEDAALASGYLNATVSPDRDVLYYLADVSSSSREGDLMRLKLGNAKAEPECIAEDVYSARISADGNKVLFVTDMKDGTGELFICTPGGDPASIGEDVAEWTYGFSPNGNHAFFVTVDDGESTLMLYSGSEAKEIYDTDDEESIDSVYADDSGRILFDTSSYNSTTYEYKYDLYQYKDGKTDDICRDAYYVVPFGSADDFLYATSENELFHYAQGKEESITDEYGGVRFPGSGYYDPREVRSKHFLYREAKEDDAVNTLYEISLPGEGVKIGKADGGYTIDDNFKYVAFQWKQSLNLAKKSGREWEDDEVCEYASRYEFDDSGSYLYYIESDESSNSGDLCRISTASGKVETLLDDATQFLLWDGKCYAVDEDNEVYLVKGEDNAEELDAEATSLFAAKGGVYAVDGDEINYLGGGDSERIARGVSIISPNGLIVGSDN